MKSTRALLLSLALILLAALALCEGPEIRGHHTNYLTPRGFGGHPPELVTHEITDVVAFSPDGTLLASGGGSEVALWSRRTRRVVAVLRGPEHSGGGSIAFSPDGRWLASACYNGIVVIWDVASRKVRVAIRLPGGRDEFIRLTWSSSSDTLLSAFADGRVFAWGVPSGTRVRTLPVDGRELRAIAFSADDHWLAVGSEGGLVIWDWRAGRVVHTDPDGTVDSLGFTPDGKWLAVGWWSHQVPLTGSTVRILALPSFAVTETKAVGSTSMAVLHTRNSVLLREKPGKLVEWNPATRTARALPGLPEGDRLVLSPDDSVAVLAGGNRGRVTMSSLATGELLPPYEGQQDLVADLQFLDSPHRLFWRTCHALMVTDVAPDGSFLRLPCDRGVPALARCSRDGRFVALDEDQGLAVWDLVAARRVGVFPWSDGWVVTDFQWTREGASLAVAVAAKAGEMTRNQHGSQLVQWVPHQGRATAEWAGERAIHTLHPGGHKAILGGALGEPGWSPTLVDLGNGRTIRPLSKHTLAAFSPDGQILATAQRSLVSLWTGPDAKPGATLPGHPSDITHLAFSRDSRLLASLDAHSIRVWDVVALEARPPSPPGSAGSLAEPPAPLSVIDAGELKLYYAVFSPDGRTLLVKGEENAVRVYDVATGARLGTMSFLFNTTRWFFITPDGRYDGSDDILDGLEVLVDGRIHPLVAFDARYHVPGLLASILEGGRPPASRELLALPSATR